MALEGQLEDVSLADVCQLLALGRKTGRLTVTDRSSFGHIHFHRGRVVSAQVLNQPDRLGDLLVRNGALSPDELTRAMEHQGRAQGRPLGDSVVELGLMDEEEVARFLTIQVSEAVYHLFTWSRGTFHFEPDEAPANQSAIQVSIHTEGLLLEGARRVDEWTFIQKKVPSMEALFVLDRVPGDTEDVELTQAQEKLVTLLDGTRSVGEMALETGLVGFEAAKAVYGLVQAGFARRIGQRAVPDDPKRKAVADRHHATAVAFDEAGLPEDAARELQAALEEDPRHAGARARLALLHLRKGEPERVLDLYDGAPAEVRGSFDVLRLRALALEALGSYDEALALLDRAAELRPNHADVQLARGIVLFRKRDPTRAGEALRRYRETVAEPSRLDPVYYGFAVLAAVANEHWEDAARLGREGLARVPDPMAILTGLGEAVAEGMDGLARAPTPVPPTAALPGKAGRGAHPRRRRTEGDPDGERPAPAPLPNLPELEGDYHLIRELGRGGSCAVYLARERELGRFVAIKVLLPAFRRDEEAGNRLVQEARILGRLQHPHLVMLLGVRKLAEGRLALILQYLSGTSLRELLANEGPLPFPRILDILRDVGRALAYIHEQGVVHRDVKPENLFLEEDGDLVRVADFGNARLRNRHTGMTVPERAEGTPAFMSPEQVEGRALDGRSDVYSLGLVAYEMLTGRQPWAGEGLYGTLLKQQSEALPPVSHLRPETPPRLQAVVERALAKDPRDRWGSATDFLEALLEEDPHPSPGRTLQEPSQDAVPEEAPRATDAGPEAVPDGDQGGEAAGGEGEGMAALVQVREAWTRFAPHVRRGGRGLGRGTRTVLAWGLPPLRSLGTAIWAGIVAVARRIPDLGEVALLLILVLLTGAVLLTLDLLGVDLVSLVNP